MYCVEKSFFLFFTLFTQKARKTSESKLSDISFLFCYERNETKRKNLREIGDVSFETVYNTFKWILDACVHQFCYYSEFEKKYSVRFGARFWSHLDTFNMKLWKWIDQIRTLNKMNRMYYIGASKEFFIDPLYSDRNYLFFSQKYFHLSYFTYTIRIIHARYEPWKPWIFFMATTRHKIWNIKSKLNACNVNFTSAKQKFNLIHRYNHQSV